MSCKNRTEAKSIPVCGTGATVLDELSYTKKKLRLRMMQQSMSFSENGLW